MKKAGRSARVHGLMSWRRLFPFVFLFTCIDGFISNWLYPAVLPLLYRDFLIIGVYGLFIAQEPVEQWTTQLRKRVGPGAWLLAVSFVVVGLVQVFNPLSADVLVGLLGLKVLFLYWPLAILAFAYIDSLERARGLLKAIVFFSVPMNLFGLYQFWRGPEFLASTFGPGFERATLIAFIEGVAAEDSFLRIPGTFASTGQFSGFLLINTMFCFGLLFSALEKRERMIVIGCAVLNFLALLATGSRGALVVLVIEAGVFALLCRRARQALGVALLVGLSLYYGFSWLGESVVTRFESLQDLEMVRERTVDTTSGMFVEIFNEYPFGRGLGTASLATRHLLGEDSTGWAMVENYLSKLQMETGILGVLLFYLFMGVLSFRWLRYWLKPLEGPTRNLEMALTAYCVTSFVTSGLFGSLDSPPQSVFLWPLIGIAARLSALPSEIRLKTVAYDQRPVRSYDIRAGQLGDMHSKSARSRADRSDR
jgi:hypothetical protein